MPKIRRILHPTDFSPASRPAFRRAIELARTLRGELILVHVQAPVIGPMMPGVYIPPATYDGLQATAQAVARRQLDRLVVQARRAKVRVVSRLADGVPVHDRIVRIAKAVRAGVIVMGTHGRSGVSRVFLGSVAARVVATAPCPVLTVRGR